MPKDSLLAQVNRVIVRHATRILILLLVSLCSLPLGRAAQQTKTHSLDLGDLAGIMAGDYIVVGKKADARTTYSGRLTFSLHGKSLDFKRIVHGHTVRGTATFDSVTGDRIPILRMLFTQDGRAYEGTYQWASDYGNYIRFTGYVYLQNGKTKMVGVKMLFPKASTVRGCSWRIPKARSRIC